MERDYALASGHIGGHIEKGLKRSPFVKKHLVPMSAFGHDLVSLVQCLHGVSEGDLELLHEAEVAGSHFSAVGRCLANNRPVLVEGYVLVL